MTNRKKSKGKDPKRVKAGKKAWRTRQQRVRDRSMASIPASFIPGYGVARGVYKAYKAEKSIRKNGRKNR